MREVFYDALKNRIVIKFCFACILRIIIMTRLVRPRWKFSHYREKKNKSSTKKKIRT